jgi:diguanylate cyclase (GGDEF)-like protein
MPRKPLSLRTRLALTIVAMGALGMVLTLVSSEIYRKLMLDTQRSSAVDQLRLEATRLREEFELRARALAVHAQGHPAFLRALGAGTPSALTREIDELYRRASSVTVNGVRANRVYLFDANLRLTGTSSQGDTVLLAPPCTAVLSAAARASGRNRPTNRICLVDDRPFYVALAPLMIPAGGYLYVVGDAVAGLTVVEQALVAPMRLRRPDGSAIYQSAEWPPDTGFATRALATYTFAASAPRPLTLELAMAKDMGPFYERLDHLRYLVLMSVAIFTAIAVLIALAVLERGALRPMRALMAQLQRLRHDKEALGEQVQVSGSMEIAALADEFNDMSVRLRESYQNLEHMAFTDSLTELPNRSLFQDRLHQAILAAKRDVKPFALLFMDLDRFKDINDTLGHAVGDLLLKQVAQRLRSKLRASDTVARMGGDEFAVMLPAVDEKHAGMAARMLLQALRAPFVIAEHNLNIGASIGIALYPENGVDESVLMQRADVAMYAAKTSGSGFAFYTQAIDQNLPTRLSLLQDLRQAVEHEQFELFYQPVVNLATSKVTGVEALARWRHPRDGILLPDRFIPLLEQSGMISGLMPWVVSEALKRAHALNLAGLPLAVSVNLSMRDLQDPYIVDSIGELLQAHEVDPNSLVLEITESAVMTDAPRTMELLNRLAGMGLRIAIDDFGTGYSSLTYLKKLPVTTLKIDKSFVSGMIEDDNDAAIVRTSIDLAHNLGLTVVAEGVETEAALKHLKALGCDFAQGHYVGRPLSRSELDEWLVQSSWGLAGADPMALIRKQIYF